MWHLGKQKLISLETKRLNDRGSIYIFHVWICMFCAWLSDHIYDLRTTTMLCCHLDSWSETTRPTQTLPRTHAKSLCLATATATDRHRSALLLQGPHPFRSARLSSQTWSLMVASTSSLRRHVQRALLASTILSLPCPKLSSRHTDKCPNLWLPMNLQKKSIILLVFHIELWITL